MEIHTRRTYHRRIPQGKGICRPLWVVEFKVVDSRELDPQLVNTLFEAI